MSKWGQCIICDFTFPVCHRTIRFTASVDYKTNSSINYYIEIYNGYKPRLYNGCLHKTVFMVSQKRFYRLLNARGKKLGLTFNLKRLYNE